MQPWVVPEQEGFGSLQVGTQSGALSEYTWSSAVQVCSVMIQTYIKLIYYTQTCAWQHCYIVQWVSTYINRMNTIPYKTFERQNFLS